ncbi:MAG: ABC transporter [Planctomycetota bacterium]|nr:MAG: ABC transporter [Planctomycetota bacterium]
MARRGTLRRHLARHARSYLLGALALILVNLCDVALPLVLKLAIDDIVVLGGLLPLVLVAGVYAALVLALGTWRYLWRRYFFGASHRIANELRAELFAQLERMDQAWFDRQRTGDLMSRATNDLEAVRMFCSVGLLLTLDTLMYFVLIPPAMVGLSGELALWALLPLLPVPFVVHGLGRAIRRRFGEVQESFGRMSAAVEEAIGGVRVIKSFAQEPHFLARFGELNRRYRADNMRLQRVHGMLQPVVELLMAVAVVVVIAVGGPMAIAGEISVGDFVAFHAFLLKLGWPLRAVGFTVSLYQRGMASMARLEEVLQAVPAIRDGEQTEAAAVAVGRGEIEIRGLTFRYPGSERPALQDVNLRIPAGWTVALVGAVGAGKSTLLDLILRLYEPPPETVLLDGRCVRRWPVAVLRAAIGYVPQETFLFAETIADNVALGAAQASEPAIRRALERAQILAEVERLPGGLEARLGERGIDLSGGQRQRLAIARALVREPRVLLLDDCLSAVDAETEAAILGGLKQALRGRTAVIASHRLAAIQHADWIVVLEAGRVVEQGRHAELLGRGGLYAAMWRRQRLERALEVG